MTDDINDPNLQAYPPWKQAVKLFLACVTAGYFKVGEVIPKAWLFDAFGLKEPQDDTPYKEAKETQIAFMEAMQSFSDTILCDHLIMLRAKPGFGYRWVPPEEQAETAWDDFIGDANKIARKVSRRVVNTDLSALTHQQRRERDDIISKMASFQSFKRQLTSGKTPPVRKLPPADRSA